MSISPDYPTEEDPFEEVLEAEVLEADVVEYEDGEWSEEEEVEEEDVDDSLQRKFMFFQAAPAWLVSTVIHALILLILAFISLGGPENIINVLSASSSADDGPEIEEFVIEEVDPGEVEEVQEEVAEPVEVTEPVEMVEPTAVQPMEVATVPIKMTDFSSDMAPAAMTLSSLSAKSTSAVGSRSADMKKKLLREYGGTESSEAAVTEALKWFARHQISAGPQAGAWTHAHNEVCRNACGDGCKGKARRNQVNSATALALLPFLGAGQTHRQGDFKRTVARGLVFLSNNGKPGRQNGLDVIDYRGGGNMYDHGLATIALCEAYAMTGDSSLGIPAQGAVNFVIAAQCRDGGWRYSPRQSNGGDTSVVGWQVMALKSAHMGHLTVPPQVIQGSILFLDKVSSNSGSIYGYAKPTPNFRAATTSVGLLCRMYTGWDKNHPSIVSGVEHLSRHGVDKSNLYYDYYAAQVLRHHGGAQWEKFNTELRDWLVDTQAKDAGAQGSWFFKRNGHMADTGRLCTTSFATMILEVYYRHMPLYAQAAADEEFPL